MYSGNMAPWEQYPKQLRFSEVVNPLQVLVDFFNSGKPKSHRRDLKLWRYYVTKDKSYKDRHGAGHILFIHVQNVQLMEAMHLLLISNKDRWPRLEDVTEEQLTKEKETWSYFPKNLSPEELANPYRALRKCFKKISPQQYRDFLHEWLQSALYTSAADETNTPAEIIDVYGNIRKLYSAAWLIHQRETSQAYLRRALDQDKVDTAVQDDRDIAIQGQQIAEEQLTKEQEKHEDKAKENRESRAVENKENEKRENTEFRSQAQGLQEAWHIKDNNSPVPIAVTVQQPADSPGLALHSNLPTPAEALGLGEVKRLVLKKVPAVQMIVHLGTHRKPFTYYLLVLIADSSKAVEHEVSNTIEDYCKHLVSVMALVHKTGSAKKGISEGNVFWNNTLKSSNLIYQQEGLQLPEYQDILKEDRQEIAKYHRQRWGGQAQEFLKGAKRYYQDGNHKLAAFLLHQAVESALSGVLRAAMGYRIAIHNLSRMLRLTLLFTEDLLAVFELNTEEGRQSFALLQDAYSHARYRDGFEPGEVNVKTLLKRVEVLIVKADDIYERHIN